MRSFHGFETVKQLYLNRLRDHYNADEIIQFSFWNNGKGCAVGCTIHPTDQIYYKLPMEVYKQYEKELGIPRILALLKDSIFEGLPNEESKEWPIKFLESIKVGSDLSSVWNKFSNWIMKDETKRRIALLNKKHADDTEFDYLDVYNGTNLCFFFKNNHYIAQSEKLLELLRECV